VRSTWLLYGLLFGFSVPWYFPIGSVEPFVLGFPIWCFVSLCCYVGVALLTVWRIDELWSDQVECLQREGRNVEGE
jgi:hypothetical protein